MHLRLTTLTIAALVAGSTVATAADPPRIPTLPPVIYTPPPARPLFAGINLGIIGGITWGEANVDFGVDPLIEFRGPELGVLIGADMQRGNFVFGVQGEIMRSWEQGTLDYAEWSVNCIDYWMEDSVRLNWVGTARLRAGFTLGDQGRLLVYGTVGLAVGSLTASRLITATDKWDNTWVDYENEFTLIGTGLVWGAGAEVLVNDHFSLGVLYRRTRLNGLDEATGNSVRWIDHGIFVTATWRP